MIRTVLVTAVVAVGVTAVVAQTDPIAARKDLMKQSNKYAKSVNGMVKGEEPFTSETVAAAFATWDKTYWRSALSGTRCHFECAELSAIMLAPCRYLPRPNP